MDLDAVLDHSYKTLLSSSYQQIALKRLMLLLRFPPFWTKTTSCPQVISSALSLEAENVQIPLEGNVVSQDYKLIQKEEGEPMGSKI